MRSNIKILIVRLNGEQIGDILCVCVCVCVCEREREKERERERVC